MAGQGRTIGRLAGAAVGAVSASLCLLAVPASALTLTAHTNRGGTCHLRSDASRTGDQIRYGVKVNDCSTRFGVRYTVSRGQLYDRTDGVQVRNGTLDFKKGGLPYSNHRAVGGTTTTHAYQTKIDISVVLKSRRNASTRKPERWRDPGGRCRVKTTYHAGDTLGCELNDKLAAG
jgi:hypothetical protein